MRIQFERQVEDAQIKSARAVQDIQLKGAKALLSFREQELRLVQRGRSAQLDRSAALGQLQTGLDPTSGDGLAAQITLAVERYKNGIKEADENKKLTEEKIQLETFEAQLKLERFKQDSARSIARLNEDSTRKIADINDRLAKQREESFKFGYDFTLKRLIAEKKSEEGGLLSQMAGQEALINGPFGNLFPELQTQARAAIAQIDAELTEVRNSIGSLQRLQGKIPATPQVQGLGSLPSLTDTSGPASQAESELIQVIEAGKTRLAQLTQENSLYQNTNKLIQDMLNKLNPSLTTQTQITESLKDQLAEKVAVNDLIRNGVNPAIAEELVNIDKVSENVTNIVDALVTELNLLNTLKDDPELQALIDKLLKLKDKQPAEVAKQKGLVVNNKAEDDAAKKRDKQAAELDALYKGIGNTIQTGIVDAIDTGIEGLINGTKDLGESLQEIASGVLKDIGKQLLSFGVKLGLQSLGTSFFAEGGYVTGPTNAVIGEGGEPEYVIPESKMRESMGRYSRGSRGSSVIPAEGGGGAAGTEGGVAVSAPIDVRYTVERINSVDYVTADQFQTGMKRAALEGAQRGQQLTLSRLQQSPSTRRRIGM
jgi:hypothetical protein